MQEYLKQLRIGKSLSQEQMRSAMKNIFDGGATPAQIGAFLMALSLHGETIDEITGAAQELRARVIPISAPSASIDCCGTGGDHTGSYNISTAVALVAASCGVPVAKHGNRAASSLSGAADVLESLGVNISLTPDQCTEALQQLNFAFLMAPAHHASLKPLAAIRRELGFRTLFNLMGPLANPATTKRQLIGVFDQRWVRPMAEVLKNLGSEKAWIVHGADGLDEITLTGETYIAILQNNDIREGVLTPADFGLPYCSLHDIQGGNAEENAAALRDVLKGVESAYLNIVLANTAAVLMIAGAALDLRDGVQKAHQAIDSGNAYTLLENYKNYSNKGRAACQQ